MSSFLWSSIIGSIVLTVLLNAIPRLFPRQSQRAEQRLHDYLVDASEAKDPATPQRKVKVWFPWKGMLIASVVLTVLLNVISFLAS